jgi:hypothetical protein
MSVRRDPDVVLAAWLDDGPTDLPSSTRRAISTAVRTTPQARAGFGPLAWRPTMSRFLVLAGAAAVVAVGIGLFAIAGPRSPGGVGGVGGASPTASPTASPSPTPSPTPASPSPSLDPSLDTSTYQQYASTRYGYTVGYPAGWSSEPATRDWSMARDRLAWPGTATDRFIDNRPGAYQVLLRAYSVGVPKDTVLEDWAAAALAPDPSPGADQCPYTSPVPTVVDGHAGQTYDEPACGTETLVLVDGRMYVFDVGRPGYRPLLDAFVSTARINGVP